MTVAAETVLRPTPGEGLLARAGDLVLLCHPSPEEQAQELLRVLERVSREGGDGRSLVRGLTRAVHGMDEAPALVAYGPTDEGQALLVHGFATAFARTAEGQSRLDGQEAVTWVDRVLHGVIAITGTLGANPPGAVSMSVRLDDGVVPAGGFALTDDDVSAPVSALPEPGEPPRAAPPAPEPPAAPAPPPAAEPALAAVPEPAPEPPAPEPPPAPAPPTSAQPSVQEAPEQPAAQAYQDAEPVQDFDIGGFDDAGQQQYGAGGSVLVPGRAPAEEPPAEGLPSVPAIPAVPAVDDAGAAPPLPEEPPAAPPPLGDVPEEQPAAEAPPAAAPEVLGIYCKNEHFNDPEALYCGVCGISMAQQTHVAQPGSRPPLGVLVLDDGQTFQLDTTYIIGREPEPHQDVARGHASPVRLHDPDALVSRAHAMVTLDGWNVQIVDLGSANGTFVLPQGGTEWTQLHPHYRTTITPGTRIAIGRRGFLFESHRKF